MRLLPRALATAALGALAGAACLVVVAGWSPAFTLDMDREVPSYASGFYPVEREGELTFVWTKEHAEVALAGLDRRAPWTCEVRFRGSRPADERQPDLAVAVDGVRVGTWAATNDYQDARVTVPASPSKPGLVLSLTSSRVYEPGPVDPRRLGVQVDRVECAPSSGIILPPRRALGDAAGAAALLGAGFALTGVTAGSAVGAALLMALGQALALNSGGGLYGAFPRAAVFLALAMALVSALAAGMLQLRRERLRNTARFVITFSVGVLYLQMLALLHPAKLVVDAVFHAHRFDAVLAGHLYFTQLSTSATPFPYAIGLYLFSVPWAFLTSNHVALLRVVVSASEVLAGALLYPMVVKTQGNRLAGAIAVALFSLVPVSYSVIGNANLTSAFGQAVSIVAITAAVIQAERLRRPVVFAGLAALTTLGLVSHISTLVLLTSTLVVLAALFWRFGGQPLRGAARWMVGMTVTAIVASTVIYWGHFGDVYRVQIERARAAVSSTASSDAPLPSGRAGVPALGRTTMPLYGRAMQAAEQSVGSVGWPIALLAFIGVWRWIVERARGRLELAIAAWVLVWIVFVSSSVLLPGNKSYQQDAYEFISRVVHATLPAVVLLAARAAAWGWRAGVAARITSMALLAWAVLVGLRAWSGWLA